MNKFILAALATLGIISMTACASEEPGPGQESRATLTISASLTSSRTQLSPNDKGGLCDEWTANDKLYVFATDGEYRGELRIATLNGTTADFVGGISASNGEELSIAYFGNGIEPERDESGKPMCTRRALLSPTLTHDGLAAYDMFRSSVTVKVEDGIAETTKPVTFAKMVGIGYFKFSAEDFTSCGEAEFEFSYANSAEVNMATGTVRSVEYENVAVDATDAMNGNGGAATFLLPVYPGKRIVNVTAKIDGKNYAAALPAREWKAGENIAGAGGVEKTCTLQPIDNKVKLVFHTRGSLPEFLAVSSYETEIQYVDVFEDTDGIMKITLTGPSIPTCLHNGNNTQSNQKITCAAWRINSDDFNSTSALPERTSTMYRKTTPIQPGDTYEFSPNWNFKYYTAADASQLTPSTETLYWVEGYVCGVMQDFTDPYNTIRITSLHNNHIVLSSVYPLVYEEDGKLIDYDKVFPVGLYGTTYQSAWGLKNHPEYLGKHLLIRCYVGEYLKTIGVKNTSGQLIRVIDLDQTFE